MIVSTKAFVLKTIKFNDTSLIVKCYTELGVKSYLIKGVLSSKKNKIKPAYFQPLNILELIANHNNKGNLNSLKEVKISYAYNDIPNNIAKQSILLFLTEILNYTLQEEEPNKSLFDFLNTSLQLLDTKKDIANFHLLFLLKLTGFLGFYPQTKNINYPYFNLQEGQFETNYLLGAIKGQKVNLFKSLLGINFDSMNTLNIDKNERNLLLDVLINYYELHISGFKKINSLPILKIIFN